MNLPRLFLSTLSPVLALQLATAGNVSPEIDGASIRPFRFHYGATVVGLTDGDVARVWVPVPASNEYQSVRSLATVLPAAGETYTEKAFGNTILYFEIQANASGMFAFTTSYEVTRHEVHGLANPTVSGKDSNATNKPLSSQFERFLQANAKVPIEGKPIALLNGLELASEPLSVGRQLYELVNEHMKYDKSVPGYGQGDVLWACDSRTGNCTDFHSLFIALARNRNIPARFEIGFPLPEQRGSGSIAGYHCWAMFYVANQGWVPVDISEADKHPGLSDYYYGNLTEDRVHFTTGRDIQLVPRQNGPPLNYFVYPYIEVHGNRHPKQNIRLQLQYQDVKPTIQP